MNSLEKICLCYVARNACRYKIPDFKALNVYILRQLVSYLSAYHLNRLHDVFDEAGVVEVERVWKQHFALHWCNSFDLPATIFISDKVCASGTESRRVYLETLFQKIISNLDSGTDEPKYVTNLKRLPRCRHGVCFQCFDSTELDNKVLQSELPLYSEHVQVLVVSATSPMVLYLLKESNLLKILQRTVRRLDMRYVTARNFTTTWELIRMLVQEGSVEEFSLFEATVSSSLLENLMRLVSGQQQIPDSVLDPIEHPIAEVEMNCSLSEDDVCGSTEKGGDWFSGCEDDASDIPHAMVTVADQSENFTGTSENLISEDSVGSNFHLVDDDLYDVALTTTSSVVNNTRNSLVCLCPRDTLNFLNTSSLSPIAPTRCNVSSCNGQHTSHLRNSSSEHPDHAAFNSETSSHFDSDRSYSHFVSPPRSCSSFTVAYYDGEGSTPLQTALVRVLRNWTALRKLAFVEVFDCSLGCNVCPSFDASEEDLDAFHKLQRKGREDFQDFLYRSIEGNQLTHFVACDADLGINIVDVVARALLAKQSDRPLQEITINYDVERRPPNSLTVAAREFFGTVCLNFNSNYYGTTEAMASYRQFITSWLRHDRALRSVYLPILFSDSSYFTDALQTLERNERIEELHLDAQQFDISSISSLVSVLQTCPSLRKLSLIGCDLSNNIIDGKFVEAISAHPKLMELNLADNYLEDAGCELLKAICLQKSSFNSLNLRFNRIEGQLLFETCQEIQMELEKRRRSRFPLSELDISGNIFHVEWRNRLVQTLSVCVDVLVAQDPYLGNPAGPMADHISQM